MRTVGVYRWLLPGNALPFMEAERFTQRLSPGPSVTDDVGLSPSRFVKV